MPFKERNNRLHVYAFAICLGAFVAGFQMNYMEVIKFRIAYKHGLDDFSILSMVDDIFFIAGLFGTSNYTQESFFIDI
jgi:hypothetical protein